MTGEKVIRLIRTEQHHHASTVTALTNATADFISTITALVHEVYNSIFMRRTVKLDCGTIAKRLLLK